MLSIHRMVTIEQHLQPFDVWKDRLQFLDALDHPHSQSDAKSNPKILIVHVEFKCKQQFWSLPIHANLFRRWRVCRIRSFRLILAECQCLALDRDCAMKFPGLYTSLFSELKCTQVITICFCWVFWISSNAKERQTKCQNKKNKTTKMCHWIFRVTRCDEQCCQLTKAS